MPLWLIQIILIAIAIYRFSQALKYKKSESLFIKEIRGNWIDKSRINEAKKLYFMHDVSSLIFLITFPALIHIAVIKPFLVHMLVSFIVAWFGLYLWWFFHFSAKKQ